MAEPPDLIEPNGASTLDTRVVTIGKLRFAVGTMWLSWATASAEAADARIWLAGQQDGLPAFDALFIAPGVENRIDVGLSGVFRPQLRALAQVVAAHADVFAPQLPSETFRWGLIARTASGTFLCAATRDGLPLVDTLVDAESIADAKSIEAARARIDERFTDIHWMPALSTEEFEQKLLEHAGASPIAVPRVSKTRQRILMAGVLAIAVVATLAYVQHYRAEAARAAALARAAAAKPAHPLPGGYQTASALDACLRAFQRTEAAYPGWHLVSAACDVHGASFVWRRGRRGLALTAPAGARVTASLRAAMLTVPLRIERCVVDSKRRYARIEAAISDWAAYQHEHWRAVGGVQPSISIDGIIPSWEMPVGACVHSIGVKWTRTGLWHLQLGW